MNFKLLQQLSSKPQLYQKGTSLMWTDPYISKQLLQLHINPEHDVASRSKAKIEIISNWILTQTDGNKMNVLDLGCGPGLYCEWFAQQGHSVTGVDFSENSIDYATQQAKEKNLSIQYLHKNYLELEFENAFDLIILIYLDFGVLMPEERIQVLQNAYRALKKGGIFICDVLNDKNVDNKVFGKSWDVQTSGFWRDKSYLALTNGYHYPEAKVMAEQHLVIEENDSMESYIFWSHYFNPTDLMPIFAETGFNDIKHFDNVLPESNDCWNGDNVTFYVVRK